MRKAVPGPTPETQPYWDAARRGELMLPRCVQTGRMFFYPQPYSPFALGGDVEWVKVSGRATLYSYVINHRPAPGFQDENPYVIAVAELSEGPRLMTNLVGIEPRPECLTLDMALVVTFDDRNGSVVPVFMPAEGLHQ